MLGSPFFCPYMKTTKEIVLSIHGDAVIRTINEETVSLPDDLANSLTSNSMYFCKNVFVLPEGRDTSIAVSRTELFAITNMPYLNIRMPWKTSCGGFLSPVPATRNEPSVYPVMSMRWIAPDPITLLLISQISDMHIETRRSHLFAYDSDLKSFRLPLPNIYDDGAVCMGSYDSHGRTLMEIQGKALTQLDNSQWNSDLYTEGDKLSELMSYKVEKNEKEDTFSQIEFRSWHSCVTACETRVSDIGRKVLAL